MEKKVCSKCRREFPLCNDYFEKRKTSKDGFRGVCRECRKGKFLNAIKNDRYLKVEEFVNSNSNCKLIDKIFKNVDTKMEFECECGEHFYTTFYNFKNKNKRQCNICSGQQEWTFERLYLWIKDISKCELIKMLGMDKNYGRVIKLKCNCGEEFITDLRSFNKKKDKCCNLCSKYKYYNIDIIRDYVFKNSNCKLVSEIYKNIESKLIFQCDCGEEFETTFTNFVKQNKRHCDKCGVNNGVQKKLYSYEEVKEYIESNSGCKLISKEYIGCTDKLKLKCPCGEEFEVSFDKFKNQGINNKTKCDICNKRVSKPVILISNYLDEKSIQYSREYRFDECKHKKYLPFDFYLNELNTCIEYDGEFHFKETSMGNDLKMQIIRDNIKTKYCKDNNIKLIRIPYWEQENIIDILNKELAV